MKKTVFLLFIMLFISGVSAYAEDGTEIYLDGEKLYTEAEPVNIDGRVLVPMRAIFEALGADVSWDDDAKTVWASREGQFISVNIPEGTIGTGIRNSDDEIYWVSSIELDVPAQLIDDYTYVPIRAVSEILGAYVTWDGEVQRVLIDSRDDEKGVIYYASDSDFQYLYSVGKNGRNRRKLSNNQTRELEMYDGYVYYLDMKDQFLYRANNESGEELVLNRAINKIAVADGYVYYQELDGRKKTGPLYRLNIATREIETLNENHVQYPEKYRNYIYFNLDTENYLYALDLNDMSLHTIDTGDCAYSKLYSFNCLFYGDYILVEDGVWFGDIMRTDLDGGNVMQLTKINAIIEKNQQHDENLIYMQPDDGQDIYCINIDGTNNRLVHEGDPMWLDIDTLAQWGDTVYYKHPMRYEVYRVNLDGSDDRYICYADSIQVKNARLFSSFEGLYMGGLDGSDMVCLFDKSVSGFAVMDNDTVYFKDKDASRLGMVDFFGRGGYITCDACGEWVESDK